MASYPLTVADLLADMRAHRDAALAASLAEARAIGRPLTPDEAETLVCRVDRVDEPRYARGMAWTTDRDKATWFADRWGRVDRDAYVYSVIAEPAAILADVDAIEGDGGRRECEIVVDPAMLPRLRRAAPR
jgi:hypothetical protein